MLLAQSFVDKSESSFLTSFSSEEEALESIVKNEPQKKPWQEMFSTDDRRQEVIVKMMNYKTLRSRLIQSLSGMCSVRKRSTRDVLFNMLNYKSLLSRSTTSSAEAIEKNRKKIEVAPTATFAKAGGGEELDSS